MNLAKIFNKWWLKWLILGVAIRLILMPITFHPDILGHSYAGYIFAYLGKMNFYDFIAKLPPTHPLIKNYNYTELFIYPPVAYYTLGIFRLLVKPFADPNYIPWVWSHLSSFYSNKELYLHLFLFKLPYIFFDIAAAFLLSGLFEKENQKKAAFILWMFNPVTIYATFMMGQFDILPTFFTILALYLMRRQRYSWAMISLGIGASYKMYPLFFVIPAAFFAGRTFWEKLKYIILGFAPYILSIIPFIPSAAFRQMVLFNPKDQKMLYMIFKLTGAEGIYPFVGGLMLIFLASYFDTKKRDIAYYFLAILLLLYLVTSYHPQWFLWVTPFMIYELVKSKFRYWTIAATLFVCWLVITLLFESSLSYGLFSPIAPLLANAPSLSDILAKYTDVFQLKSLIRSVFAGASIYYIYRLFSEREATGDTI
jgi:hypothetical protein